jgi:hypothetical protein
MSVQNKHRFLLKGIDPNKLLNDYKNGKISVAFENIKKFPLASNNKLIVPVYGISDNDPIFSIKDRNNNSAVIATTGYDDYELFMADGECPSMGGRCDFCKQDFNHRNLGYPVAHEEYTLLINHDIPHYKIHYIFWMYGETCSLECSLSKIRENQFRHSEYKENLTKNSEYMLHKLFKLMYPNSGILRPAQNPKLLKINKGSLTEEEWQNPKFLYKSTDRILMLPIKMEYLQKSI